eukprot:6492782-Amphidinium_carterae.4
MRRQLARMEVPGHKHHKDCGMLRNYVHNCQAATDLVQTASFASYSDSELAKRLEAMTVEKAILPFEIKKKILERKVEQLFPAKDWAGFMFAVNPFSNASWDHYKPVVGALETSEASKLSTFENLFFTKVLKPLLQKGDAGLEEVTAVVQQTMAAMDDVDPIELSTMAAAARSNIIAACDTIQALMDDKLDTSKQAREELQNLKERHLKSRASVLKTKNCIGKSHKSLLVEVAAVIDSTEFWSNRLEGFVRDITTQMESEVTLAEALEHMDAVACITEEGRKKVQTLLDKFPEWRAALRPATLKSMEQEVMSKLNQCVQHALENKEGDLKALGEILASAHIAFPMSADVDGMKSSLSQALAQTQNSAMVSELDTLVAAIGGQQGVVQEFFTQMASFAQKAANLTEVPDKTWQSTVLNLLSVVLNKMQGYLTQPVCNAHEEHMVNLVAFIDSMVYCVDKSLAPSLRQLAQGWEVLVAAHFKRHKLIVAIDSSSANADDEDKHSSLENLSTCKVLHMQLLKCEKEVKEAGWPASVSKDAFLAPCATMAGKLGADLTKEMEWWKNWSITQVSKQMAVLTKSTVKGKQWKKDCDSCKSMASLLKLGKETLLTFSPDDVESARTCLEEAQFGQPLIEFMTNG